MFKPRFPQNNPTGDKTVEELLRKTRNPYSHRCSAKLFRHKATEKMGSWTLLTLPKNESAKLPSRGMIVAFPTQACRMDEIEYAAAVERHNNDPAHNPFPSPPPPGARVLSET